MDQTTQLLMKGELLLVVRRQPYNQFDIQAGEILQYDLAFGGDQQTASTLRFTRLHSVQHGGKVVWNLERPYVFEALKRRDIVRVDCVDPRAVELLEAIELLEARKSSLENAECSLNEHKAHLRKLQRERCT